MRHRLTALVVLTLVAATAVAGHLVGLVPPGVRDSVPIGSDAGTVRDRLHDARTFALALGTDGRPGPLRGYDLVVVDGDVSATGVRRLRRSGAALVLGYLSVGTIERDRWWSRSARRHRMDRWDDWDEWYADTSHAGFRRLIVRRVAPSIMRKGFDGLFLDNVDMTADHPRQRAGMRALVRALSRDVRGRGGILMAQNGAAELWPLRASLDAWNLEDVSTTYDFDRHRYVRVPPAVRRQRLASLRRYRAAGLVVTATDALDPGAAGAALVRATNRSRACAAGALSYSADIGLRHVPAPRACPDAR